MRQQKHLKKRDELREIHNTHKTFKKPILFQSSIAI